MMGCGASSGNIDSPEANEEPQDLESIDDESNNMEESANMAARSDKENPLDRTNQPLPPIRTGEQAGPMWWMWWKICTESGYGEALTVLN